jgi:hypothetical protein
LRFPVKRIVLKAQQEANRQVNQQENQPKLILASKKKHEKTRFGLDKMSFLKNSFDEYSSNTPYLQHYIWKKTILIFFS